MASPHHIECPSCRRTHGPPTGAMCRYAKAAKERCAQLGMGEEDYMLYLSDISEENPKDMTGGQLSRLLPDVLSNPVQETKHQSDKNVKNPETNQQDDVHQASNHYQDISHKHSDQNKRKEFKGKAGDEGYESFMSNAPTTTASYVSVLNVVLKSPHANGGQIADMSEHEAVDTEQHIGDRECGAQACITVKQEEDVCLVLAQDMQIRETVGQELHLSGTPESECEINEDLTQDMQCAGDQEEVVANVGTTQAEDNQANSNTLQQKIRKHRAELVETLDVRLFEHLLSRHLKISLEEGTDTRIGNVRAILDKLARLPDDHNEEFAKVIAGLYPDIFKKITGKRPSDLESVHCISELSSQLRKSIIEEGHKTDLDMDEKISLQHQFVQLLMVDNTYHESLPQNTTPDEYQEYLNKFASNATYKNILPSRSKGMMVLLRGRAGIGKTTLVQWLLHEWAHQRWAAEKSCAFMLNLRYLMVYDYKMTLRDLLTKCSLYCPDGDHPQLSVWMNNWQEKLLLYMDGIDEMSELKQLLKKTRKIRTLDEEATCLEWCINILRGDILRDATKIVSSRPFTGLDHLRPHRIFEVLGLSEEQVNEFITKNVPEEKKDNVEAVFSLNPTLRSVCSITFYASQLCKVLQDETDAVELNISTYSQITAFIILKGATRNRGQLTNSDPMEMAAELKGVLPLLAKLSWKGLQGRSDNPQLIFDRKDFHEIGIQKEHQSILEKTDLIHMKVIKHKHGGTMYAELLHLSVQEMLAMAEVLQSDEEGLRNAIAAMATTERFNMTQLFLMGLALDTTNEWIDAFTWAVADRERKTLSQDTQLQTLLQKKIEDKGNLLQSLQAIFESQSEELAKLLAEHVVQEDCFMIRNINLTAVDASAIVFVMKYVQGLKSLKLEHVSLDKTSRQLIADFLVSTATIEVLELMDEDINEVLLWAVTFIKKEAHIVIRTPSSWSERHPQLNEFVPLLENIFTILSTDRLNLPGTELTERGAAALAEVLKMDGCCIKELDLSQNEIGDAGAEVLGHALRENNSLQHLELGSNQIEDAGAEAIGQVLRENATLLHLHLSSNEIRDDGAEKLARGLRENNSLQHLKLGSNHIGAAGAEAIGQVLKKNATLLHLDLTSNGIKDDGAEMLARGLRENNSLQHLDLFNNQIGAAGAEAIGQALKENATLLHLDLGRNQIGNDGAERLAHGLKENNTLQYLDLSYNRISEAGEEMLRAARRPPLKLILEPQR